METMKILIVQNEMQQIDTNGFLFNLNLKALIFE